MAELYEPKRFPKVERWRPFAQRYLATVPTDFVLAWIHHESGGRPSSSTSLDERGIFQVHPGEAEDMGMSSADFSYLAKGETSDGYDPDKHFRISSQFVRFKESRAQAAMERFGLRWTGRDFWTLVKLHHGLPSIISKGLPAFKDAFLRVPNSFAEFASWLRRTRWTVGGYDADRINTVLTNAEHAGQWAGTSRGGLVLLATAVIAIAIVLS